MCVVAGGAEGGAGDEEAGEVRDGEVTTGTRGRRME